MAKCIVIGGGLAGLSTAVHLSKAGHQVELIEASPKLGGRAYSFQDKKTNTEIDNGQHILMGAYKSTFEFLKIIGASNIPDYQKNLDVKTRNREGVEFSLKAPNIIYPFNLLYALIFYQAITIKEKFQLLKLFGKTFLTSPKFLYEKNVEAWLVENNQSRNVIKALWEIIGVGALNTKLSDASAELFSIILTRMFFKGNEASTIVLPKLPLNKLFIDPAISFFQKNNISYSLSEKLISLEIKKNKVKKIITEKREIGDFDNLVLAIPQFAYEKINSNEDLLSSEFQNMETTAILTAHIWYEDKLFDGKFIGLIDSEIHWIFKNENHLSIVISASDNLNELSSDEIIKIIYGELSKYFSNFNSENVKNYTVIKEKRATLMSSIKNEKLRGNINSNIKNIKFAGDWTNTKLPGTIEGAILSGKYAAEGIKMINN